MITVVTLPAGKYKSFKTEKTVPAAVCFVGKIVPFWWFQACYGAILNIAQRLFVFSEQIKAGGETRIMCC